ncbi:probable disease resistance RPP8-like protein 2 isoform X1 [Amaranthus tricolor]|uniref:probable disease resistance RPP8-like protein 2 isoform X1 n=1 Tax=Amaranthus tricolor TaxID=29722 RepID=UPI00258724AB|nr:probable disease resistance RPP8-like protein 2 isoform X1 [Amaranthus tricolor]
MDKFAVCSAAQRIEYWLNIDPEPFSKVSKEQISDLQNVLLKIQDLLGDNEVCRNTDESAQIKEAANDVEDVFDTFVYNARSVQDSFGIAKIAASMFNVLINPDIFSFKIQSIQQRLEEAVVKLDGKVKGVDLRHIHSGAHAHEGKSMYGDNEYIVGLQGDIEEMVHHLTSGENEVEDPPYLFFIVGGPSSGKTTLARQLYNNTLVRQHFHNFIWYGQSKVNLHTRNYFLRHVLVEIMGRYDTKKEETWINVIGKCLIILDEIPCSMRETLEDLLRTFPTGLNGTKIIITGSNEEYDIFKNDLRCYFHQFKGKLNDEQGWDLLCHLTASRKQNIKIPENLAKNMLRICEGKPISIKLLSGVLSTKPKGMEFILDNHIKFKDVYELCYEDLHYLLKAYFLYLRVFPPKHEISAGIYQRMWIAEGFVSNSSENEVMQYLEELSRRHLIQVTKRNHEDRIKIFQVSNLVYEFCLTKAQEENFLHIESRQFLKSSINSRKIISRSRLCKKSQESYIRSLSLFHYQGTEDNRFRFGTIYKDLKLLRVLSLWGVFTSDNALPDKIGKLVHLSYLGIRNTNIDTLPQSIENLEKLLTLDWRGVHSGRSLGFLGVVTTMPNVLWKMEQLRHLYIPKGMSLGNKFKLHTLNNLHTLWGVRVNEWFEDDVQLWNFPNLHKLYVFNIYWRHQLDMIFECLKKSPNLKKLKLEWETYYSKSNKLEYFDQLSQDFYQLSVLILTGPIEEKVSLRFPPTLVELELENSGITAQDPVPIIGRCCPKLKVLRFKNNAYLGTEMRFCAGKFQSLVELVIEGMYELETWVIETGALPRLEKLFLKYRTKLERLPEGIRFITTLRELVLHFMPRSFCEKLVHVEQDYLTSVVDKIKGEDFYLIQHVPDIKFTQIWDKPKVRRFILQFFYLNTE